MARNEEKALTLFNKWQTFKKDFHAGAGNRRPLVSTECMSLSEAENHRRTIVRDITKKVAMIQNGEHRVRELNDEINKHMRQKHYWEIRIRELGGSDYKNAKRQFLDVDGKELPGAPNYKYYGVAKDLPGVRELFAELEESAERKRMQRSRGDLYKNITPDYYGYRDDDDGILEPLEAERERELIGATVREHAQKKQRLAEEVRRTGGAFGETKDLLQKYIEDELHMNDSDVAAVAISTSHSQGDASADNESIARSHISLPAQDAIEAALVEQKKKLMLEKYAL